MRFVKYFVTYEIKKLSIFVDFVDFVDQFCELSQTKKRLQPLGIRANRDDLIQLYLFYLL